MLYTFFACLGIGAVLLAVFLRFRVKGERKKAIVVKALVSVFFLLTLLTATLAAGAQADWTYSALLAGGLILGLLGDIWLDLKYIYPQDGDFWTFSGFFCFMAGHFFYMAAVIFRFGFSLPAAGIALIFVAVTVAFLLLTEKPMKMHYGKFKPITLVYGCILVFMFGFCLNTAIAADHGNVGLILMAAGGLFFLISDLILSGTYFSTGKDRPVDIISNHVTYYIAQYCIASSALFLAVNF